MQPPVAFDGGALMAALDAQRADRQLDWSTLAAELWQQSAELNSRLSDHCLCPGALVRTARRGTMSCQYALTILRWLNRAPEEFLTGPVAHVGDGRLPTAGRDSRLRWDLAQLHESLNHERRQRNLTWAGLADELGCTPSRLTNLRNARLADMDLTMRITQWLGKPAACFIQPAQW
jgi:hypothetical protein